MNNEITRMLDIFNIERHRCKCCGGDIIYSNTRIKIDKNGKVKLTGKNFNTIKCVDDIHYKLQVCEKCLLQKFPNIKNLSRTFNVMSEPTKFAFDLPDNIFNNKRKNYAMTKNKMIEKYGEDIGLKKWEAYCKKQSETNTFEFKHKIYGWTKEQFDEFNKSRAVTKHNLIKRYGEDIGLKKWEAYCKKQSETKSWEYMVEKFGIEKARQINKSKALCLETFVRKHGEQLGQVKFLKYINNLNSGVSKISQTLFNNLDKYLKDKFTTYYHSKNKEFCVITSKGTYFLDFYIKELNICIEFNGSCFHGDERIYNDNDLPNPFNHSLTAKQLRDNDQLRYRTLFNVHNIKTFIIWELDFDPEEFDYKKYITDVLKINI
jgi:hypothetical protein